jgi:hypothetical protein
MNGWGLPYILLNCLTFQIEVSIFVYILCEQYYLHIIQIINYGESTCQLNCLLSMLLKMF